MAARTVNARFSNGVLTPLEPLDLPEGSLVKLNIQTLADPGPDAPPSAADEEEEEEEDAGLLQAMLEAGIDDPNEFVSEAEVMATLRGLRDSHGEYGFPLSRE